MTLRSRGTFYLRSWLILSGILSGFSLLSMSSSFWETQGFLFVLIRIRFTALHFAFCPSWLIASRSL
ncbi:MAG: hypothetical protein CL862_09390 [Cyanobium sp. NAT70]|nr:hypothetical protein [Cyanobium sp. NAT70]